MFNMELDRPIVFFDLETTGTNYKRDRIVEISVVKYMPNGEKEVKTRLVNPEMPIPKEASDIHGITDDKVANEPTFKQLAKNFFVYLEGCDLGGYNITRFDIPVLVEEFRRSGLSFEVKNRRIIDPFVIFCKMEPRTLTAAYKFFCGKELVDAHSAEADNLATVEVLMGQLSKYDDLPKDVNSLAQFCDQTDPNAIDSTGRFKWSGDVAVVNFGKNSGTPLSQIVIDNPGFLNWMINQDFEEDAKQIAKNALKGVFPTKDSEA